MFSVAPPVFVNVTFCAALEVFSCWLANVRLELDRLTFEDVPAPANVTITPAQVVDGQVAVALYDPVAATILSSLNSPLPVFCRRVNVAPAAVTELPSTPANPKINSLGRSVDTAPELIAVPVPVEIFF